MAGNAWLNTLKLDIEIKTLKLALWLPVCRMNVHSSSQLDGSRNKSAGNSCLLKAAFQS